MIFLSCTEKRKNIYHRRDRTLYSQSCTTNICYQQLQQRFQYRSSATLQLKIKPASRVLMMPQAGRNPIQVKSLFGPDHAARFNCRLQNTNLEHQGLEELRSRRIGGRQWEPWREGVVVVVVVGLLLLLQQQQNRTNRSNNSFKRSTAQQQPISRHSRL